MPASGPSSAASPRIAQVASRMTHRARRAAALSGVQSISARHPGGEIVGVFRQETLSDPRDVCYLTYRLDPRTGRVEIEREPGRVAWSISS